MGTSPQHGSRRPASAPQLRLYILPASRAYVAAAVSPEADHIRLVLAEPLNTLPKYVASTTLAEPLDWQNSRLLRGEVGAAVRALKGGQGRDLHVIGSPGQSRRYRAARFVQLDGQIRGLKTLRSLRTVAAGHAFVQNLRRGHYQHTVDVAVHDLIRLAFTELARCL